MLCYVCYVVVLLSILLLMVKLLLKYQIGNQGMFPIPALVKVIVAVSGRKKGARNREPFPSSFYPHICMKNDEGHREKTG